MAGILEVCADSMESALAAERGGADRIELCGNLVIGGTTPSQALFEKIRKETSLKIRVLLRPRFGDFCYSQNEYEILKEGSTRIFDLSVILCDKIWVGMGSFPERSQYRNRNQIPGWPSDEVVPYICSSGGNLVYLCAGIYVHVCRRNVGKISSRSRGAKSAWFLLLKSIKGRFGR